MKKLQLTQKSRRAWLPVLGISLAIATCSASDVTWNGSADGSTMSLGGNWVGGVAPVANDQLFFDGNTGLFPNNDITPGTIFSNITFKVGAGAFTLGGNGIRFPSGTATIGVVTNSSPNTQTISLNLTNNGGPRIYRADAGPVILSGLISGNTVVKEGASSVTTSGAGNVGSPGAVVNEGTLIMAKSSGNAFASTIVVHTNGTARTVGPGTDQIHFNQRVVMNGGVFQLQHVNSVTTTTLEEIASLSGSNLASVVECGLAASTNRLDIGGGNNHRGIYSGTIRDGAAGQLALQIYRANNYEQLNGTNTYSGVTLLNNSQNTGAARLIVNGAHVGGGAYTVAGSATDATRVAYLHGSGVISASVINVNANALLSPGGSLSADLSDSATYADSAGILTISNTVNLNASSSSLEVQLNGTTAGSTYDQVYIAGSGTFSNNSANLKLTLGYAPAPGDKFTLVKVDGTASAKTIGTFGSFNGVVTSMAQGAVIVDPDSGQTFRISYRAEGGTFDMGAGNGNDIMLEAISPVGGAQLTWRGDAGYDWDIITSANWRTTGGAASTFTNADFVTFDNSGSNSSSVNLTTDLMPATVLVNASKDFEFDGAGKLTGLVILTKTNTGKLTITTDNDNSGAMLIRQGTVQIGTNGTTGRLSGNANMRTNTTLIFNRSDTATYSGAISGTGTLVNNGTNGTMILTADSSFNGITLANAGTLQFGDGTGSSGNVNGTVTNRATVAYSFNANYTMTHHMQGTGKINLINTSTSSRRFTVGGGPSTLTNLGYSGFIDVGPLACLVTPDLSSGTNQLGIGSTVYVEDTGSVLLDRGGNYRTTFYLQGAGNGAGNAGTPVCFEMEGFTPITTVQSNVYVLSSTSIGGFIGTSRIAGQLIDTNGASTITFANGRSGGTAFNLQLGSVNGPNHWGTTVIDPDILVGQRITITAMAARAISTNGLTIGAHGIFALNGFDHTVASLSGPNVDGTFLPTVVNSSATTPAVLSVGTDDSSTTFAGVFGNGGTASLGLTKVGAGTLSLSGTSSNTGPVTVSSGVIALSGEGSFSNSAVLNIASGAVLDVTTRSDGSLNLNNGQTLKGNGGLNGNLVTLPGSIVNPGASIGTLNVSNNATLGGTLLMEVNRSATPNCDHLNVAGTLAAGGTLAVTNIGGALQANDTFQLFSGAVSGFTVGLPTYDTPNARQYTWQNDVAVNGSVKVLTSAPIGQPVLTNGVSGSTITFSWAGPFKLQSQTNSLSVGVSNNWFDYPGGGSSPVSVPINRANPTVFFRLTLQ